MTRDEARAIAALMLAYADGKTIQMRDGCHWHDRPDPEFKARPISDYRIKPEPKELWVNEYGSGRGYGFPNADTAKKDAFHTAVRVAVHYREVCDE